MITFPLKIAVMAILAFALALTFSCSDNDNGGSDDSQAIRREKISGISQKGPFAKGASVTIYELNAKFEKTKNFFKGKTDDDGNFEIEIKNGTLASPYIILEASGNYFNEVSGKPSTDPITLNAIADVSNKSIANINVLTNLELDRVLKLVKSGKNFGEAKKQAQKEVLNAIGLSEIKGKNSEDISLFGSSPSDSVLLAVSVLLQGDRSTKGVSDLLANFSREIENNGTLSNPRKSEVDRGLDYVDMDEVRDNILNLNPDAKVPNFDHIHSSGSAGKFIDDRNKQSYKWVTIGKQVWMAENLNYEGSGNYRGVCYDNNPDNCTTYGRLYDWETANEICPRGWHLPDDAEWTTLTNFVGVSTAGTKLKSNSDLWTTNPGTDDYGFSALPGGGNPRGDGFQHIGTTGLWWTATEGSYWGMDDGENVDQGNSTNPSLHSVRCVRD